MATHSSILSWEIPWTEEPGGLHGSTQNNAVLLFVLKLSKANVLLLFVLPFIFIIPSSIAKGTPPITFSADVFKLALFFPSTFLISCG